MVGLGEVGDDGGGEGLVSSVSELDGALAEFVGLEGVDAVADDRIVEEMLDEGRILSSAHVAINLVRHGSCFRIARKESVQVVEVARFEIKSIACRNRDDVR